MIYVFAKFQLIPPTFEIKTPFCPPKKQSILTVKTNAFNKSENTENNVIKSLKRRKVHGKLYLILFFFFPNDFLLSRLWQSERLEFYLILSKTTDCLRFFSFVVSFLPLSCYFFYRFTSVCVWFCWTLVKLHIRVPSKEYRFGPSNGILYLLHTNVDVKHEDDTLSLQDFCSRPVFSTKIIWK